MFKIFTPLFSLTVLISISAHANAQRFVQTVVDEHNQVLPIFFDAPHQSALPVVRHQQTNRAVVRHNSSRPVAHPSKNTHVMSQARQRIVQAAYSALGTPYIYGGNNPARGLDCSSLMQYIYQKALGKELPRTAAVQRDKSRTVSHQSLQPGDLLFFKINRRSNHVGVYIGHGKFIHASYSKRRAIIDSMEKPYWKKRFVKFGSYLNH